MGTAVKVIFTIGMGLAAGWLAGTHHNRAIDKSGQHLEDVVEQLPNPPPEPNVRIPRAPANRDYAPPRGVRRSPGFEPNRRLPPSFDHDGPRRRPPLAGFQRDRGPRPGQRTPDYQPQPQQQMPPPPPIPPTPNGNKRLEMPERRLHRGSHSRTRGG